MLSVSSPSTRSALALTAVLIVGPAAADAATITISGVFTAYDGPAGGCDQFTTIINGVDVTPAGPCDPGSLTAPISVSLGGVSAVDFHGNQLGTNLPANNLTFVPAAPQEISALGDEILLGVLQYTNGTWFGSGPTSFFGLELTTSSLDPMFDGHTLVDQLVLNVTPTIVTGTPEQNADFVYFASFTTAGSFRVYESFDSPTGSNTAQAAVYGRISSIIPTRFADVQGGGFFDPGVSSQPTTVPEPGTLSLLGSALAVALVRRQRGRS